MLYYFVKILSTSESKANFGRIYMIKDFYVGYLGLVLKYMTTGLVIYRTFGVYEKSHINIFFSIRDARDTF